MIYDDISASTTYFVAAAVDLQIRGECDSSDEEEKSIERINDHRKHGVKCKPFADGRCYQVEERKHSEYRHEHGVVDDGWIARRRIVNHIPDQSHDEESP